MIDVTDTGGVVVDVNITITTGSEVYFFDGVQNPLFWNSATYGCVLFGLGADRYIMEVSARDS